METSELITIGLSLLQVIATFVVAWVLFKQANNLKKVEIQGQAIQAYNVLNAAAIASDENLMAFDSIGRKDIEEDIEKRRKRWCAFVWLQSLQLTYHGMKASMVEPKFAEQTLIQQLELILNDDDVYWLVCNRGFDPEFAAYCKGIREQLELRNMEESDKRKFKKNQVA
jgi:hypothetical protein